MRLPVDHERQEAGAQGQANHGDRDDFSPTRRLVLLQLQNRFKSQRRQDGERQRTEQKIFGGIPPQADQRKVVVGPGIKGIISAQSQDGGDQRKSRQNQLELLPS